MKVGVSVGVREASVGVQEVCQWACKMFVSGRVRCLSVGV